jgi:translation initiation factor IF-2
MKNNNTNKPSTKKIIVYKDDMNVSQLAEAMQVSTAQLIKKLFLQYNINTTINKVLDRDLIEIIAGEEGYSLISDEQEETIDYDTEQDNDLIRRPPIVTIMGHVDHGKTTLLDTIKKTKVALGEAGGITQHIGAYQVNYKGSKITFIDTPGHAAFREMRARGAKVTDIVVIVVAADDGVMPQTREAIEHAKASNVSIIIALNKIDKAEANKDRILSELADLGILVEAWGGTVPVVEISALKNINIDKLLETIILTSEMDSTITANPNRLAKATVIEAKVDKGRGSVATIIIENGTLKLGDYVVVGSIYGKIRSMTDSLNKQYKIGLPSDALEISGLSDTPDAGNILLSFNNEKEARSFAENKELTKKSKARESVNLLKILKDTTSKNKQLNLIIKTDVSGSIQPIRTVLENIKVEDFEVSIVKAEVGAISENDISLAHTIGGLIIGFNVRPNADTKKSADIQKVVILLHNIIYKLEEEITNILTGRMEPIIKEVVTGELQIRQVFRIDRLGNIAGCVVNNGYISRHALVRVIREGVVVYEGAISSLKRGKDDVKEVKLGYECGVGIKDFNDIKVGDIIEASIKEEQKIA